MEKIVTQNPDPHKKGAPIDKERYEFVKQEILSVLKESGPLSAMQLVTQMDQRLGGDEKVGFSIGWYTTAIRLDLEARGLITYDRSVKMPVVTLRM